MGLRRLEAEIDLKSPAEKLYLIWRKTPHHMPDITPNKLQAVEHHDGHWDDFDHGSHKTWEFTMDGEALVFKERIEFDDANMKATFVGVGGHPLKFYKSFINIFQFIPKEDGAGTLGKITVEYVKLSDDMPDAINYLNFIVGFITDSDEHLAAAAAAK